MRREFYAILPVLFIFLSACPTYEDEFTARYRETPSEDRRTCFERRECGLLEVDFFRFGDFSQAIVREFDRGPRNTLATPFVEPTRCSWTRTDRFRDQTFSLAFERRVGGIRGKVSELELQMAFLDAGEAAPEFLLQQTQEDPEADCSTIGDYGVAVTMRGEMPPQTHLLSHPVFVVLWLGLERIDTPGGTVYAGTQGFSTFLRLPEATIQNGGSGLAGRVDLIQVLPPDDRFLSVSGSTSFAMGHFIVVDDQEDSGRFNWSRSEEPIVATSLLPSADPAWDLDDPVSGKALLFVRGSLFDLDPALQERISNLEDYEYPDQNFFVVDVVADGRDILEITLPERRIPDWPVLRPTSEFLEQSEISLPRLFPFNSQ